MIKKIATILTLGFTLFAFTGGAFKDGQKKYVKGKLGGDIFIHGACVTIGCLPITDDKIKELYIFCVEAKDNGQEKIPVTIFPAKLSEARYLSLREKFKNDPAKLGLWEDLKTAYDSFNEKRILPGIIFLNDGRHRLN